MRDARTDFSTEKERESRRVSFEKIKLIKFVEMQFYSRNKFDKICNEFKYNIYTLIYVNYKYMKNLSEIKNKIFFILD